MAGDGKEAVGSLNCPLSAHGTIVKNEEKFSGVTILMRRKRYLCKLKIYDGGTVS